MTLAGGFTEKALQTQVKLTRRLPSGVEQTTMLDLSGADPKAREFFLKDGDILLVPAGNTFYVLGRGEEAWGLPARSGDHGDPGRRDGGGVHGQGGAKPDKDHQNSH